MHMLIAAATVVQAFNLNCSGAEVKKSLSGTEEAEFSTLLHVDIEHMKYCVDDCKFIREIKDVQPTVLNMRDDKSFDAGMQSSTFMYINRETGAYKEFSSIRSSIGISLTDRTGQCSKEPFTPFPAVETKF